MRRCLLIAMVLTVLAMSAQDCCAQRVSRGLTRNRWYGYGGLGFWEGPVQYGPGGYYYWPENGQTAYSNAVRAQAELTMAQGIAAENYARAAAVNEQVRRQYLENKSRYDEMRRQQRAAAEARKAQEREAQRERAARRPPPKKPTEIYPRLSTDELDPLTGEIRWPPSLQTGAYARDRDVIEDALLVQAENGPDARTAKIIFDAARRMRTTVSSELNELGFETYSANRRFLNSLAIEGDHAMEAEQ